MGETAVANKGPQAITVAAEPWQFYGGGIFHGCSSGIFSGSGATLDHGVQLVGYSQDYWIVRNSWGAGWGEKGFIRVSRQNDAKTFTDKKPSDGVACAPYPETDSWGRVRHSFRHILSDGCNGGGRERHGLKWLCNFCSVDFSLLQNPSLEGLLSTYRWMGLKNTSSMIASA